MQLHIFPKIGDRGFVGRRRILKEISDRLFATPTYQQLAICGFPGIGKTQIAQQVCYHFKEQFDWVFWISAFSRPEFKQDYLRIAMKLGISGPDDNSDGVLFLLKAHFESSKAPPWLLVVDGVDDWYTALDPTAGIYQYLPDSGHGKVLFTTRHKGIALEVGGENICTVNKMDLLEARELFDADLGFQHAIESEEVDMLLRQLSCLPLAISQAASFMRRKGVPIKKYLVLPGSDDKDKIKLLSHKFPDATRSPFAQNAIASTWLISFRQVQQEDPAALQLLKFLAFTESRDILPTMLPGNLGNNLASAVETLQDYSFLVKQEETEIYEMHRLLHQALIVWVKNFAAPQDLGPSQIAHFLTIFANLEGELQHRWQRYLPHAIRTIELTAETPSASRATLCLSVSRCLRETGRFGEALDLAH